MRHLFEGGVYLKKMSTKFFLLISRFNSNEKKRFLIVSIRPFCALFNIGQVFSQLRFHFYLLYLRTELLLTFNSKISAVLYQRSCQN